MLFYHHNYYRYTNDKFDRIIESETILKMMANEFDFLHS